MKGPMSAHAAQVRARAQVQAPGLSPAQIAASAAVQTARWDAFVAAHGDALDAFVRATAAGRYVRAFLFKFDGFDAPVVSGAAARRAQELGLRAEFTATVQAHNQAMADRANARDGRVR